MELDLQEPEELLVAIKTAIAGGTSAWRAKHKKSVPSEQGRGQRTSSGGSVGNQASNDKDNEAAKLNNWKSGQEESKRGARRGEPKIGCQRERVVVGLWGRTKWTPIVIIVETRDPNGRVKKLLESSVGILRGCAQEASEDVTEQRAFQKFRFTEEHKRVVTVNKGFRCCPCTRELAFRCCVYLKEVSIPLSEP